MRYHIKSIFSGKKVILIGGKPPLKDWSDEISKYDIVVRINYPRYLDKKIGYAGRTDVLFMGSEYTPEFSDWIVDKLTTYQVITWTKNFIKHKIPPRKRLVLYPTILPEFISKKISFEYLPEIIEKPFRSGLIGFYMIMKYGSCKQIDLLGFSQNSEDFLETEYFIKSTFKYFEADKYHCSNTLETQALIKMVESCNFTNFIQ